MLALLVHRDMAGFLLQDVHLIYNFDGYLYLYVIFEPLFRRSIPNLGQKNWIAFVVKNYFIVVHTLDISGQLPPTTPRRPR